MEINNTEKVFGLVDAILSLTPKAQWTLTGDEYSGLDWISEDISKPAEGDLRDEAARLQTEYDALEYQRLRAPEYPDFKEYLDGVVKGDQAQIDAYIAACQAVKDKYPKPE